MTSRAPSWPAASDGPGRPGPHPDVDQLADLAEELADPADVPALRQHLAGCPECAETYATLADVRELLGTVENAPIPADVAERIDAALAAEALRPLPQPAAPRSNHLVPSTSPTAPAAHTAPTASTASTAPAASTGPGRGRAGRRRGRLLLGAATLVAAVGLGALLTQPGQPGTSAVSGAASPADAQAQTDHVGGETLYSESQLDVQIRRLVSGSPAPNTPRADEAAGQPRYVTPRPTDVPACLLPLTGHGTETPISIGQGRFGPDEVTVLVYPIADQVGQLDVYLVTRSCADARVLLHRTVDR